MVYSGPHTQIPSAHPDIRRLAAQKHESREQAHHHQQDLLRVELDLRT